jgi:protein-tyrosine phosphatase
MTFLPTKDMTEATKRAAMVPAAFLLHGFLQNNHKVYVHCNCGMGGS